jgi:hypothetical protein
MGPADGARRAEERACAEATRYNQPDCNLVTAGREHGRELVSSIEFQSTRARARSHPSTPTRAGQCPRGPANRSGLTRDSTWPACAGPANLIKRSTTQLAGRDSHARRGLAADPKDAPHRLAHTTLTPASHYARRRRHHRWVATVPRCLIVSPHLRRGGVLACPPPVRRGARAPRVSGAHHHHSCRARAHARARPTVPPRAQPSSRARCRRPSRRVRRALRLAGRHTTRTGELCVDSMPM